MASATPEDGLAGVPINLAALGYDGPTAVYDISGRTVYLPHGLRLEAHSGFGADGDDPRHVNEKNVGATPPAVYDLKLRASLVHGIQVLRMIPVKATLWAAPAFWFTAICWDPRGTPTVASPSATLTGFSLHSSTARSSGSSSFRVSLTLRDQQRSRCE
jgi:Tlde1 domain